jgi:hypothetical protein
MWQEPEIDGMITFKSPERWDQSVVPRPGIEAGGGRLCCTFLNKSCCRLVVRLCLSGSVCICAQFLHCSKNLWDRNVVIAQFATVRNRTVTYGGRTYECTFVYGSVINTLRTGDEFSRLWRFLFTTLKDR